MFKKNEILTLSFLFFTSFGYCKPPLPVSKLNGIKPAISAKPTGNNMHEWDVKVSTFPLERVSSLDYILNRSRSSSPKKEHKERPRIIQNYKVVLSEEMRQALHKYDPDFKIWKGEDFIPSLYSYQCFCPKGMPVTAYLSPSAIIADFTGDNIPDAALYGHNNENSLLIAVVSEKGKYKVIELEKMPWVNPRETGYNVYGGKEGMEYGLSLYLYLIEPFKTKAEPEKNTPAKEIKTYSFTFGKFELGGTWYYYKDGKFIMETGGD